MKWIKICISTVLMTMIFIGCVKDDIILEDENIVLTPGLHIRKADGDFRENAVHKPELNTFLKSVSETSLIYDERAKEIHDFSVGQVFYIDHPNLVEDVVFKKVKRIEEESGLIRLICEEVNFDEFFKWLDLDFSVVYDGSNFQYRSVEIETKLYDLISVSCSGVSPNFFPRLIPEFGIEGEIEMELNANFEERTFENFSFKFKDVRFAAKKTLEINTGLSCSGSISSPDYELPPITITLKGVVIQLTSRISVGVEGGFNTEGRLEYDLKTTLGHPLSLEFEIDPAKHSFPYYAGSAQYNPFTFPDINLDFNLKDISGSSTISVAKTYNIEFSFFKAYEFLKSFVKIKVPAVDVSFNTESTDQGINVVSSMDLAFEVVAGFQVGLGSFSGINLNFSNEWPYTLFQVTAFSKSFPLPCQINFTHADFIFNCFEDDDKEGVLANFRVNSTNGSPSGFRLNIDGHELGIFPYNSDNEVEILSSYMKSNSRIEVRDASSPGCRFTIYEDNPCGTRAYCAEAPFVDPRDLNEYCFMRMSDGRDWMTTNALFSGSNNLGICYQDNNNFCDLLGRYYSFEEVESGSICPSGWRIPTLVEWENMLNAESTGVNRIRHLLAPNLLNFGNVPAEHTNGFHILPAGQYQSWKEDLPVSERFTGGINGPDAQFALFWTSTPLDENSNNQFADGGAVAVFVNRNGNYQFVDTPKSAGLSCRCIRN